MRSGRVTGVHSPFKQKNSGFVTPNAISLSCTHTGIHGEGRPGVPRVEPQGSALSARKPSIGAAKRVSIRVRGSTAAASQPLTSDVAKRPRGTKMAQMDGLRPEAFRSALGALHEPLGH